MRRAACLLLLAAPVAAAGEKPTVVARPDAFETLVNPNCSHCVDEAKRRVKDLKPDDPVLAWTRGYSDGGAIPVRFFLAPYRVISDSYGVFVYDPDAGYARGFAPSYTFRFHGWRNGVMVMKDTKDGTLYSCLSGVAFAGPRQGHRLGGRWGVECRAGQQERDRQATEVHQTLLLAARRRRTRVLGIGPVRSAAAGPQCHPSSARPNTIRLRG